MSTLQMPTTARRTVAAALLGLCLGFLSTRSSHAQQPLVDSAHASPRLFILTPPGGRVGSTLEVGITGADLDGAEQLLFSHPNIKAEPIQPAPPPAPDPKKPPMPPPPPPQVTKFKVTIAADVQPGIYDCRVAAKHGVSNPRAFVVSDLNEVMEKEPNNDVPEAQRVEIDSTINGNLANPTDVDYYVFHGKKGQRVLFSCLTTSIDSRMTPGIEVYDAKGKVLAFNRDYHLHDSLTDLTVAEDGDYYVRLYEFTHTQGTAEHFYRLSITTGPWIDAIFPAVIEPGKTVQATIYGRNLPGGQLDPTSLVDGRVLEKMTADITAPSDAVSIQRLTYSGYLAPNASGLNGGFEYRVRNSVGTSNPFFLSLATAPVVIDNEMNQQAENAQPINLPCEIAGRVMKKRERNWYVFSAKKGEVYNIELLSDRLGVAGYMYFVLRNLDTKANLMESQDNNELLNIKFFTHSDDPQTYRFTAPADGRYGLMVSSRLADSLVGPRQQYRVRITPDQPDFQLVAVPYSNSRPEATTLYQGGQQAMTVFAWRRDGFNGAIVLSADGLPVGVTCPPQTLAVGTKQTTLVFSAADSTAPWTGQVSIRGTATIHGKTLAKEARAGGIVWPVQPQQNIPPFSRVERQTFLAVRERGPWSVTAMIDKPLIVQGTNAVVSVKLNRLQPDFKAAVTVQATPGELPQGFNVNNNQPITIAPDKTEGTLNVVVPGNAPPGMYNIVLRTTGQITVQTAGKRGQKQPANAVLPATPVTLTVLPKAVGTLTLANNNPQAKIGMNTEVVVKVNRLYEYAGEFKIKLVLPPDAKGLTAAEVVIPAGKDEAKLTIKVAPDAMPGNRANLVLSATATYNGTPVSQEVKFNVNVVK